MALLSPTFLLGVVVVLYLSSFVFFAIIRILTGVSIQRIGYLSLRRLAYTPRDGCRVEIRGLGLNIHRPTFAQPTWVSIALNELVVTVDLRELNRSKSVDASLASDSEQDAPTSPTLGEKPQSSTPKSDDEAAENSTWSSLFDLKDKLKKLHKNVRWMRMVDIMATNTTINIVDVGSLQVGSFTVAVDTRNKTVDRTRFFSLRPGATKRKPQAEWIISVRSVLFTADGRESLEILDNVLVNIHGFIDPTRDGLRDTTISVKFGRVHIPYDDFNICATQLKKHKRASTFREKDSGDISLHAPSLKTRKSDIGEPATAKNTHNSRDFFNSILRGIKEIQFAVSHIGLTMAVDAVKPNAVPIQFHASMKEIGIDLHRLDPNSAAHRMYFPTKDIAHEGLAAALSISLGLDDGQGRTERLLYIPMVTTTVRTTLPSKTVQLTEDGGVDEKNTNILYANSVVTSPSVDLDPAHLPLIIALLQPKPKPPTFRKQSRGSILSRFLPKANIKFSMHEPVMRIKLKPLEKTGDADDFDLIISSISSVSMDVESSHSPIEDLHYSLDGSMRLQTHDLYYQTNTGERFNLITTESFDMKVHVVADPEVSVDLTGTIQSFAVSMVRPEITDGLRQIVRQLRIDVEPEKRAAPKVKRQRNFLRSAPDWLLRYHIEAKDFNVEVAGVDEDISDDTRGVSLHLDNFAAEYRAHRLDGLQRRTQRRRTHSRSITQSDSDMTPSSSPRFRRKAQIPGDGRRLSLHAKGIEAQIIEAADRLEVEPFLSVPRLELAFSASSDSHGAMFHIQSSVRTVMMQYSLYRHYALGVAGMTLRKAFVRTGGDAPRQPEQGSYARANRLAPPSSGMDSPGTIESELVVIDFKASLVQLKAEMPHDPLVMFHVYGIEAGRHRWATPFLAAKLIRMYVQPPRMRHVWAKMVGIKSARVDLRESRQRLANGTLVDDNLIDVSAEAIRIAVPHEVTVARINDNVINIIKSVQQLHHRFKTGTNEYILEKKPEGPKKVPKISIRTRNFMLEFEDGAFEWKLGMIYRAGRLEQRQRMARDEAFEVKMKRVRDEELKRGSSKIRSRSTFARGRQETATSSWFRSRSADMYQNRDRAPRSAAIPTYDPDGGNIAINGNAKVSETDARTHLDLFNAQSWRKRIDRAYQMSQDSVKELRGMFWGSNHLPDDVEETEHILEVPPRPALFSAVVSDLHILIDKPTFPLKELPDFLHKIGKGMPKDMEYGLLVPMHVSINMNETRLSLRDYPLPLLHIPGLKSGQSSRLFSVSLKTNFVLAEEFRGVESTRRIRVNIVPPRSSDPGDSNEGGFAIEVRRSIGPVKSFTDVQMDINTGLPTRFTWGPCYQPAIQDMMMVVESFTKAPVDPSDRVGFWDKLRLNFHSRIRVAWKGDGDVHLCLKGTRDPYQVTGHGAGFLMCWRNDVRWNINAADDPKRLFVVQSGEYVWAVPDFGHHVREAARRRGDDEGRLMEDTKSGTTFKKVVMKLSGKVEWIAGLTFESEIVDGKRNFEFIPHYDVVLKNPHFATSDGDLPYDAYRGFRSRHIHLSIAVRAPADREWLADNPGPSRSYNTVHLTPRFFTHFFTWWALFSQPMSLPIRQGNLFPGHEKSSKKFGRHLATIKYSLLLAPLFLSHIYKHKDAEDYMEDSVAATGVKVRFDSFMLDLHSRREEFNTLAKTKNSPSRTSGIKIHAGHLDLACADLRAVSASLKGTTVEALKKGSLSSLITDQDDKPDLSRFTIPDDDFSWIDMDDFVELDWTLPTEAHPDTKILPLAYAPRITYFRQTDIGGVISGDPTRTSPFGNEPTHFCTMTTSDDPKEVQAQLIQERLNQLSVQMSSHKRNVGEAELNLVKSVTKEPDMVEDFEALRKHTHVLKDKETFLQSMLEQMEASFSQTKRQRHNHSRQGSLDTGIESPPMDLPEAAQFESEYNNRFVVHNMQLKWNNLLRNIVLRYFHQVSQRRGFVYYLSRPAVKFILDIVDEQSKKKDDSAGVSTSPDPNPKEKDAAEDLEARIRSMIGEGRRHTNATFTSHMDCTGPGALEDLEGGIAKEFSPQNTYHVRLIAPQIQLQSDKNKKHVVLVTSKGMELKVVEVMDKERISDTVSGLVQRRLLLNMDSTQFFVTHQKWFLTNLVSMYAGSRYGTPSGSAWPPWVPMEIMFDFQNDPFGFKRVVQKTSAMLRYDKYNNLRLKYNDEVNEEDSDANSEDAIESRSDSLRVEFPQARALCNSSQYYALYVIALDLLMYSEPLEKTRSERLEKIMLASDFSDLSGAPEMVQTLQERIRHLEEIKLHFHVYSKYLDRRGWEERLLLERDLAACEDELFFIMKAITTSQRKHAQNADTNALLKWSISIRDIVWHLIQDSAEPLVELQLKDMEYDRTDNSDGSHINLIRVGKILGLNLLKDATYPEIIAPYYEGDNTIPTDDENTDMIRVYWHMLEAIAGIPVMDRFEVNLFPMKVQLERDAGKRLFEYIFPGMDGEKGKHDGTKSEAGADEDDSESVSSASRLGTPAMDRESTFSTRPGSLELRLQPTLSSHRTPEKNSKNLTVNTGEGSGFRLFRSSTSSKSLAKKTSHDSLRSGRPGPLGRSSTGFSTKDSATSTDKKSSRFGRRKSAADSKQQSDDLTKMINRASNFMTFAYIKMPSVVLCVSYRGKDQRNFEDVHNFVFRLPTIEWRNKTWSNLDLALALKKAVIKALISHTGAIIGNKFSKHRPNAEQRSKLRELASSNVLIAPSTGTQSYANSINDSDDSSSLYGVSPIDYSRSPPQSRGSTQPFPPRPGSRGSSIVSRGSFLMMSSNTRAQDVPAKFTMTPPTPVEATHSSSGLGIDFAEPEDAGSPGSTSHRRILKNLDRRPSTSGGEERRKSVGYGLRDKISAFTHRMSHRESPSSQNQNQNDDGDESEEGEEEEQSPRVKKLSWSQGRTKTG